MSQKLSTILGYRGNQKTGGAESVWNLFVQILLPLILILLILAVQDIARYKDVADEEKERSQLLEDLNRELRDEFDPEKTRETNKRLIIELQRQKLLKALTEVNYEEKKRLKLESFSKGNAVKLDAVTIIDNDFIKLCREMYEALTDKVIYQGYLDTLYHNILKKAELKPLDDNEANNLRIYDNLDKGKYSKNPGIEIVKRWSIEDEKINDKIYSVVEEIRISKENRAFIHNRIIGFLRDTKGEIVEFQRRVLVRILQSYLQDFISHPEILDKDSADLVRIISNPNVSQEKRDEASKQFQRKVRDKVKSDIGKYYFLPGTLEGLNID